MGEGIKLVKVEVDRKIYDGMETRSKSKGSIV